MTLPIIIAEIGINHNGELKIAKKLISDCKKAGFNAVKFQKRTVNLVYTEEFLSSPRESQWGNTQRDQKEGLELGIEEYKEIDKYCKQLGIDWFASAWDIESLNFLKNFKCKYNKIASAMIVDEELLNCVAEEKKYTFISTGMSTEKQIDKAVKIFKDNNCEFELMHCVSTYPTKPSDSNLLTINALKRKYNCKVGYSGHENGVAISLAAFVLGATSIERHVTLDRTMYGSDQSASLEFVGYENLVKGIIKIDEALGLEKLGYINEDEILIAKKLREHIKN